MSEGNNALIKWGLLGGLAYFGVIDPILKSIGVKDTADEKKAAEDLKSFDYGSNQASNPFSPLYINKVPSGTSILNSKTGAEYSEIIKNAKGAFNDDESAVYGIFNKCKTKSQVSSLAYYFNKIYKLDLWTYLKSFLNESELGTIVQIVKAKPNYKY